MKSAPAAFPSVSLPDVASFECSNCGAMHNSRDAQVPVGWTQRPGALWCSDCTRQGIAARQFSRPVPADKVRLRGEVVALLRQGAALMPLGTAKRAAWIERVNQLLEATGQRAA
jgi:hypothetical protein